jgi:hypothetical protein
LNVLAAYVEQQARVPLAELDARERDAREAHEHRVAELNAAHAADLLTRIADENREYAEQQKKFDAERSDIRKTAWREIRARVRTEWARFYVLALAELSLTGPVANGVGVESFLVQTVQRSGEKVTATPRLAVESEVWPNQIKVRTGTYLEPTRFEQSSARLHWTVGVDIKVLHWGVFGVWPEDYLWQISMALDIARDVLGFLGEPQRLVLRKPARFRLGAAAADSGMMRTTCDATAAAAVRTDTLLGLEVAALHADSSRC